MTKSGILGANFMHKRYRNLLDPFIGDSQGVAVTEGSPNVNTGGHGGTWQKLELWPLIEHKEEISIWPSSLKGAPAVRPLVVLDSKESSFSP